MTGPDERWSYSGEFVAPPAEYAGPTGQAEPGQAEPGQADLLTPFEVGAEQLPAPRWDYPSGREPLSQLSAAMLFIWSGCIVGAFVAPFLTFTGYRDSAQFDTTTTTLDGWGQLNPTSVSGHGLIWGVPLTVCAALLVVATLGLLTQRLAQWPALLGLVACIAIVATAGGVALEAESRSSFDGTGGDLQSTTGAGLWITMIVGLAAAVAAMLSMRAVLDWRPAVYDSGPPPADAP